MHRFYLPPAETEGKVLLLRESDAHHAAKVLRIEAGEAVVVLDGVGGTYDCRVVSVSKKEVALQVLRKQQAEPKGAEVTLFQAVPKAKLDSIIQKATELGVSKIVPLLTERVAMQLNERDARDKAEKYRIIAIEAIKQSGNPWLPIVQVPTTFKKVLGRLPKFDLQLVGALQPGSSHIGNYFDNRKELKTVAAWVGPEGDFTAEEIQGITAAGAKPVNLGPLVLRCETAAVYMLSVINHELTKS